jgi:hypothetical protein
MFDRRSPLLQPRIALGPDRPSYGDIDRVPAKVAIELGRWVGLIGCWIAQKSVISGFLMGSRM